MIRRIQIPSPPAGQEFTYRLPDAIRSCRIQSLHLRYTNSDADGHTIRLSIQDQQGNTLSQADTHTAISGGAGVSTLVSWGNTGSPYAAIHPTTFLNVTMHVPLQQYWLFSGDQLVVGALPGMDAADQFDRIFLAVDIASQDLSTQLLEAARR